METSDVRKRLLRVLDEARRKARDRRTRVAAAAAAYEAFLPRVAAPVFRQMADALTAEGHPFKIFAPAGVLRLASERSANDFIEIELDDASDPPVVLGRASRSRGSRVLRSERPIGAAGGISDLTDDDVLQFLLDEIAALIER